MITVSTLIVPIYEALSKETCDVNITLFLPIIRSLKLKKIFGRFPFKPDGLQQNCMHEMCSSRGSKTTRVSDSKFDAIYREHHGMDG